MRYIGLLLAAALIAASGWAVAVAANGPPSSPPGQGDCEHGNSSKPCKPDPQPGHGQDCDEHGPNEGGVNEDHCLPTEPPPTTTEPPPTTTEPPPTTTAPTTSAPTTTPTGTTPTPPPVVPPPANSTQPTTPPAVPPSTVTSPATSTPVPTSPPAAKPTRPVAKTAKPAPKPDKPKLSKGAPPPKVPGKPCPAGTREYRGTCNAIVPGSG